MFNHCKNCRAKIDPKKRERKKSKIEAGLTEDRMSKPPSNNF